MESETFLEMKRQKMVDTFMILFDKIIIILSKNILC